MRKPLSRQKIILYPWDKELVSKINQDAEHIYILTDTSTGAFSITLPDATMTMQRELIVKNIGDYDITIYPLTGQYIDKSISHVLQPLDLVSFWPDLVKTWWMLDNNSIYNHPIGAAATDLASCIALANELRLILI
jgi:hypothetical protein